MTAGPTPLRRADWRFLLPAPPEGRYQHLVLFGAPDGLASRLRDAGVAERISERLTPGERVDAVVALRGGMSPAAAARHVADDGVMYCEIDRRHCTASHRTPARALRDLHVSGLTPIGVYGVLPDFERARRYLPLNNPNVLGWYFSTLHTANSWPAILAESVLWTLTGSSWQRLAPWVPCFGVTAVGRSVAVTAPSVFANTGVAAAVKAPVECVAMITSGQDDGSRVVLLPFAPSAAEPTVVVKATRSAAFNGHTDREQRTLALLHDRLDDDLRATVPAPLGTYRYHDLVIGVERCAPGRAIVASSGHRRTPLAEAADDLRLAGDWLQRFHRQTRVSTDRWDAVLGPEVDRRLRAYLDRFTTPDPDRLTASDLGRFTTSERFLADEPGLTTEPAESHLITRALAWSASLGAVSLPRVWLHNDFAPWNVHRAGARLTVIDWELGGAAAPLDRIGPPLIDLLYFVTYWYHRARHRRDERQAVRELFLEPSHDRSAAREGRAVIDAYLAHLDLDRRLVPLLLVYLWVDRALDRADRRQAGASGASAEGAGENRYRDIVRMLAAHTDELFLVPAGL